jgi:hypothetical protein
VERKLGERMMRTYGQVRDYAEEKRLDYRTYAIGLDRIEKAYAERGIFKQPSLRTPPPRYSRLLARCNTPTRTS